MASINKTKLISVLNLYAEKLEKNLPADKIATNQDEAYDYGAWSMTKSILGMVMTGALDFSDETVIKEVTE